MSDVPRSERKDSVPTLSMEEVSYNAQDSVTSIQDVNSGVTKSEQLPETVESVSTADPSHLTEEPLTASEELSQSTTRLHPEGEAKLNTDESNEHESEAQLSENSIEAWINQPEILSPIEVQSEMPYEEQHGESEIIIEPEDAVSGANGYCMPDAGVDVDTNKENESIPEDALSGANGYCMPDAGVDFDTNKENESISDGSKESQEETSTPEEVVMHQELIEESTAPKASVEDCTALAEEVSNMSPTKSPTSKAERKSEPHSLHHIKTVQFKDRKVNIVTQNENGPCPLVAIINILLLRRKISFPSGGHQEIVSAAKLMEYLGNAILENMPKNADPEVQLNYEQNMNDAMAVLPKLQTGLDVNVKFTGVHDFEYTTECIIFDLLDIHLYHGWLVDPQDSEIVAAVGQAGYNQLVEKVITYKCSSDSKKMTEALIIESFLERSASQLTYHGLVELSRAMTDGEVAVLFRNNHFSTILKHQNVLLQLVTDQGFLSEPNVVWETLDSIDGDGQFVDGYFRPVPPKPDLRPAQGEQNVGSLSTEQQIDQDFLVALSLQEQPADVASVADFDEHMSQEEKTAQEARDAELARQLQQEYEQQAAEAERETAGVGHPEGPGTSGPRSSSQSSQTKKKDNCIVM